MNSNSNSCQLGYGGKPLKCEALLKTESNEICSAPSFEYASDGNGAHGSYLCLSHYEEWYYAQKQPDPILSSRYIRIPMFSLDDIPKPYSLDEINPSLVFYGKNFNSYEVTYQEIKCQNGQLLLRDPNMLSEISNLIMITHGFQNTIGTQWLHTMKEAILNQVDQSTLVILVGWGGGADLNPLKYTQAVANTQVVGAWLAIQVDKLVKECPNLRIHGIGHSLGSHLMGKAGRSCGNNNGNGGPPLFTRITGLDPAGPSFETVFKDKALNKNDAIFVDVIHSDGEWGYGKVKPSDPTDPNVGSLDHNELENKMVPYDLMNIVGHYGTLNTCGHLDFYPNWGYLQPASKWKNLKNFTGSLSHSRAVELFEWSVGNPNKFKTYYEIVGEPSDKSPPKEVMKNGMGAEMGFHAKPIKGDKKSYAFYLKTNSFSPWVDN